MTSIADLVNQIERDLTVHFTRPQYDVPVVSFNTTVTSIQLANVDTLLEGAILNASFELMYVLAWNPNTRTATVLRGFLGTTPASGTTTTMVRINPRLSDVAILDTMTDEINSWDERVFTTDTDAVAFGSWDTSVEITPLRTPYRILSARPRPNASYEVRRYLSPEMRIMENATQFASGVSLSASQPFGEAVTVDVVYAVPFDTTALSSSSNLEVTHGFPSGLLEVMKWGAMWRLTAGKEATRLDGGAMTRPDQAQAIPATANMQAAVQYQQMRNMAYDREVRRLLARWPIRFAG